MGRDEQRYRDAERALWASVGLDEPPAERRLRLARCDAEVRIQEVGPADGPPIVFVHGASNAGTSWAALAARLPGWRCLLVDRPGCGLSPPLGRRMDDVTSLGRFADDLVVDVLDALALDRAQVVGTSLGGYFALRATAAHPSRIDRLVVLAWTFGAPAASAPLVMRVATQPVLGRVTTRIPPTEGMVRSMLRQIGLRGAVDSGRFGPVEIAWFLALLRHTPTMRNEIDAMPRLMTMRGFNQSTLLAADLLARIEAPTLFLWGDDDPMGGEAYARPFAALVPGASLELLAGAGHAPWIDDPDGVAQRVAAFLTAPS